MVAKPSVPNPAKEKDMPLEKLDDILLRAERKRQWLIKMRRNWLKRWRKRHGV